MLEWPNRTVCKTVQPSVQIRLTAPLLIFMDIKDVIITPYPNRSSGGQYVGSASLGVSVEHIPTRIKISYDGGRSQIRNRNIALALLEAAIAKFESL